MLRESYDSRSLVRRATMLLTLVAILIFASTRMQADTGTCSNQSLTLPFTDVPGTNIFFCSIAQAFFTGLTNGTTATTYSPAANVTRDQMAAFITRTQDSALKRGSRRAALGQWATPKQADLLTRTFVGNNPGYPCSDGEDIWVPNSSSGTVMRVHASDGRILGTWTGAEDAQHAIVASGFIYVLGVHPARIYRINPSASPGAATLMEDSPLLNNTPINLTFDGLSLWTANSGSGGGTPSITRYNIFTDTATIVSGGFNQPAGIVFDGTHLWVADSGSNELLRVNRNNGSILERGPLGPNTNNVAIPLFDGSNIWVPGDGEVYVVSTSTPARLLATLTGNELGSNISMAFDGERILVPTSEGLLSLWKASSLTPLGSLNLEFGTDPIGVCSDGLQFWITVWTPGSDFLLRF